MDLDDLLATSAPPVASRTTQLTHDLRALARVGEPHRPTRRTRTRTVVGAGIATGILGLGVVGAAAALSDGALWFTTTSAGAVCEMEFVVHPVGTEDSASGEPAAVMQNRTTWPSAAEQARTVAEARRFLSTYDYDGVDRAAAIRRFDIAQRRIIAAAGPDEAQPLLTGNDLETTAVSRLVFDDLSAHLRREGLSPDVIVGSVGSSGGCAQ